MLSCPDKKVKTCLRALWALARRLGPMCDDRITIHQAHQPGSHAALTLCAPSLFIAGLGKCGTNALAEHLAKHPRVRGMSREVAWDPRETPPKALVRHRPVRPNETRNVWVAKHPKYAIDKDVPALASRLRAAYPSAKVALTLCDPVRLPWRRFLYLLTSSLTRHGAGAGDAATYRAFVGELRALNASVSSLFADTFSLECRPHAPGTRSLLEALGARGFAVLYGNGWLTPGSKGEAHCRQERRLVTSYAQMASSWLSALGSSGPASSSGGGRSGGGSSGGGSGNGGGINSSVALVYMEGWAAHGDEYMRMLLRMLGLDETVYPWAAVSFGQPVFANKVLSPRGGASSTGREEPSPRWLPAEAEACVRQCEPLTRISGMRPPWCVPPASSGTAPSAVQAADACWAGVNINTY